MPNKTQFTILVVDDEEAVTASLCAFLKKNGFVAKGAHSALDAIRACRGGRIDLVMLDYHMPEVSGVELLEKLRVQFPKMPILMMSGTADMRTALELLGNHAFDFLKKPIEPSDLLNSINRALREAMAQPENDEPASARWHGSLAHGMAGDNDEISVLSLYRSLDENSERNFSQHVRKLQREDGLRQKIILNLANCRYINNVGLAHLLEFYKKLRSEGKSVVIAEVQDSVYRYLKMLGYTDYFPIVASQQQAIERLKTQRAPGDRCR